MTKNAFPYHEDAGRETGASLERADGSFAEATLYNLLRQKLPPEWSFIRGTQLGAHQYDFLVLVPGKGIVNLECKGHGYTALGATNRFVYYDKGTGKEKEHDVVGQAAAAAKHYISYLADALFGHGYHWGLMGHAVVFPLDEHPGVSFAGVPIYRASDCQESGLGLVEIVNRALCAAEDKLRELGVMSPALLTEVNAKRIWEFWTQKEDVEKQPFAFKKSDLSTFRKSMEQTLTVAQTYNLSALLSPQSSSVLLEGVAGSGKTYLAIAAAQKVEGSVLFVCFNKVLSQYLQLTVPEKPGLKISHFHGLNKALGLNFGLPTKDAQEDDAAFFERVDKKLLEDVRKLPAGGYDRFDAIIVDEAQDLTEVQLRFLLRFKKTQEGRLLLFASMEQQLYPNRLKVEALRGLLPELKVLSPLMMNIRNTKMISSRCDEIIGASTVAVLEGPKVEDREIKIDDVPDLLSRLLLQYNPSDIAVLSSEHRYLQKIGMIGTTSFYGPDEKSLNKTQKNLRAWRENKCAWKSTTHAFKGLEAMVVVHLVPQGRGVGKDILYVGDSRATYQLICCEICE